MNQPEWRKGRPRGTETPNSGNVLVRSKTSTFFILSDTSEPCFYSYGGNLLPYFLLFNAIKTNNQLTQISRAAGIKPKKGRTGHPRRKNRP